MVSDFRQAESCIPTSASSRVAPYVSGGCASEPLRGWFLIFGKPKAAFPPPPPVALLLSSPVAVPVSRFAEWFLIFGKPKAAFPPPPPVALLLTSPAAVPVSRFADGF
jgi:hypothetical protein